MLISYSRQFNGQVEIDLPSSKSIVNRAAVIEALCGRRLRGYHHDAESALCSDLRVMLKAFDVRAGRTADLQDSGTAARFLAAYFAAMPGSDVVLNGSERLCQRPVQPLVSALREIGADIEGDNLPIHVKGRYLYGGDVKLPGNISSQFVSALMLIAPYTHDGITIVIEGNITSMPYVNMTLQMMKSLLPAGTVEATGDMKSISVKPGEYRKGAEAFISADHSAASYFHEISAINGTQIIMPGLKYDGLQGDEKSSQLIETIKRDTSLVADMSSTPDLVPTVVATSCALGRPFYLTGLGTLPYKESDRLNVLVSEMGKLGYVIETNGRNSLKYDGNREHKMSLTTIDPHGDHRIAMAVAPMASVVGTIDMKTPQVVSKSFPGFWEQLQKTGYEVR